MNQKKTEEIHCLLAVDFSVVLERREVEKRIYVEKGAAHGFRLPFMSIEYCPFMSEK